MNAALRRLVKLKDLSPLRARQALDDYSALVIERYAHGELLQRIWQLRNSVSAYDGAYVALCEALDARSADGEAKFWLEPEVRLAKNYSYSQAQLGQIKRIVEARRDELAAAWNKHFGDRGH